MGLGLPTEDEASPALLTNFFLRLLAPGQRDEHLMEGSSRLLQPDSRRLKKLGAWHANSWHDIWQGVIMDHLRSPLPQVLPRMLFPVAAPSSSTLLATSSKLQVTGLCCKGWDCLGSLHPKCQNDSRKLRRPLHRGRFWSCAIRVPRWWTGQSPSEARLFNLAGLAVSGLRNSGPSRSACFCSFRRQMRHLLPRTSRCCPLLFHSIQLSRYVYLRLRKGCHTSWCCCFPRPTVTTA